MLSQLRHSSLVLAARGVELFGRTGWLGLGLCAVAAIWFAQAFAEHARAPIILAPEPSALVQEAPASSLRLSEAAPALARQDQQALILAKVQQVAVSQGLAWTAADYKLLPAGESVPVSLEVRCTLKGAYPHLRATLAQWLQQVPGLAIRDVALSRPSSDVAEVEAKLQLVIFMRSEAPEARP